MPRARQKAIVSTLPLVRVLLILIAVIPQSVAVSVAVTRKLMQEFAVPAAVVR